MKGAEEASRYLRRHGGEVGQTTREAAGRGLVASFLLSSATPFVGLL
jgi:hypothetical protein